MHKLFFVFLISITMVPAALSQSFCHCKRDTIKKEKIYFSYGYNKDWFSRSTIHFSGDDEKNYDFELSDLKAHDHPYFGKIFSSPLSVPQYVLRLGYYNYKRNLGIEINFDHAKYIMNPDQTTHLKGDIDGIHYDTDTITSPDFVKFEHTNGANFLLINAVKQKCLWAAKNKKHRLSAIAKAGAGVVIPKTDVTLWGKRLDNKFHIAGYIFGIETGLRYEFFNYFFIEPTVKGDFANYTNVLTVGNGKANHHFTAFEVILTIGLQLDIN